MDSRETKEGKRGSPGSNLQKPNRTNDFITEQCLLLKQFGYSKEEVESVVNRHQVGSAELTNALTCMVEEGMANPWQTSAQAREKPQRKQNAKHNNNNRRSAAAKRGNSSRQQAEGGSKAFEGGRKPAKNNKPLKPLIEAVTGERNVAESKKKNEPQVPRMHKEEESSDRSVSTSTTAPKSSPKLLPPPVTLKRPWPRPDKITQNVAVFQQVANKKLDQNDPSLPTAATKVPVVNVNRTWNKVVQPSMEQESARGEGESSKEGRLSLHDLNESISGKAAERQETVAIETLSDNPALAPIDPAPVNPAPTRVSANVVDKYLESPSTSETVGETTKGGNTQKQTADKFPVETVTMLHHETQAFSQSNPPIIKKRDSGAFQQPLQQQIQTSTGGYVPMNHYYHPMHYGTNMQYPQFQTSSLDRAYGSHVSSSSSKTTDAATNREQVATPKLEASKPPFDYSLDNFALPPPAVIKSDLEEVYFQHPPGVYMPLPYSKYGYDIPPHFHHSMHQADYQRPSYYHPPPYGAPSAEHVPSQGNTNERPLNGQSYHPQSYHQAQTRKPHLNHRGAYYTPHDNVGFTPSFGMPPHYSRPHGMPRDNSEYSPAAAAPPMYGMPPLFMTAVPQQAAGRAAENTFARLKQPQQRQSVSGSREMYGSAAYGPFQDMARF